MEFDLATRILINLSDYFSESQMSEKELKMHFEAAVHFLGQDWLNEKRREFYGEESPNHMNHGSPPEAVSQYNRGLEEFGYVEPDAPNILSPDEFSEPTLRLINLGRYISDLSDASTYYSDSKKVEEGLPPSIRDRLRLNEESKKTMFELQVAAGYAREGQSVQLIEEGNDEPEADIRLPLSTEIFVECKRVDSLPGSAQDRQGISETLFKTTASRFDREGIAIFELTRVPDNSEAGKISQHLPRLSNNTREHHIDLPYGTLHVFPFLQPGTIKDVPRVSSNQFVEWMEFVELEVAPLLNTKLDIHPDELDNSTLESDVQSAGGKLRYREPLFIGMITETQDDFIQPVLNQFQSSLRKFDESNVNILHVDIPNMFSKMQLEDIEEIESRIGGLLWNNPKITGFCLSTENIMHADGGIEFGHAMAHMLNENKAVELPDDFELLGIPMDEFQGELVSE